MRWFASYDTDEYYVPQQHLTLQGALAAIEAKGDYAEASGGQSLRPRNVPDHATITLYSHVPNG